MNVGIICGCVPHLATFFRRHPVKVPYSSSLQKLRNKALKRSITKNFGRIASRPSDEIHLETGILGSSAQGEGKFLQTSDKLPFACESQAEGGKTHREAWEDEPIDQPSWLDHRSATE